MAFTINDFDSLISKDKNKIKKIDNKLKNLVKKISKKLGYFSNVYKYKGRYPGLFSKSKEKKYFFNFQINSEDLSLEFQIKSKPLILKFIKSIKIETLKNLRKLGDCEIAIWDKNKKVCKLYSEYLDDLTWKFLSRKINKINKPIFKFRKIYSRDKSILRSKKLINNIISSMKQMEILN